MLRKILPLLFLLALPAHADVLESCVTLMDATAQTSSTDGSIIDFRGHNLTGLSVIATAANTAGSTPTLDVTLESCRTTDTSTCSTRKTFDQCTTGSCWTDGDQSFDFDVNSEHIYPYLRAVTVIGGTSTPTYNVKVEVCFNGDINL